MEVRTPEQWTIGFSANEDEEHCDMVVKLDTGARTYEGVGKSRRNPSDPNFPRVGEELAAARALQDLAAKLNDDAWGIIEGFARANV